MMKIKRYIKLKQNDVNLYLTKIKIEDLISNYYVDIFQPSTDDGYQRPPIPMHYKKFAKFIMENQSTFIMPQSVLTAVNIDNLDNETHNLIINSDLRIVDGQHRIEGFKYIYENNKECFDNIKDIEIPVTIMVIENNTTKLEIETFINLNSKGKKISTDLAINILEKMKMESSNKSEDSTLAEITTSEVIKDAQSVAIKVAKKLNSDVNSLWYDSIIMLPGESFKIISLNAMQKSLIPICSEIMMKLYRTKGYVFDYSNDKVTQEIEKYINLIWEINRSKWKDCFSKNYSQNNRKYNKEFNLQKGIGVFSLHIIFKECLESEESLDEAITKYEKIIDLSKVTSDKWKVGGEFSSYNSQTGFKKVASIVKNA